jgi:signal transduction histidine kinase
MSLRLSHLALLLAVTILLVGIGGIAATWRVAEREFREVLEQDLEQQAELLAELLTDDSARMTDAELKQLLADAFENDDEETLWVSVYDVANGRLLSNLDHDLPLEREGDRTLRREHGGHRWHGVQQSEDGLIVQLLRRDDVYSEVLTDFLEDIVTPALVGSGVTLLLLAALITLALGPLTKLVREVEARNAHSLAPLTTKTAAKEVGLLRDSINGLMHGIDVVVSRERQFANDVAHELRTPLTTLKLALGSAEPDLGMVREEVDRLARVVEQLLTLARLDQGRWQSRFDTIPLSDLYAHLIEQFRDRFQRAAIGLECQLAPVHVAGDATLLEILLRNLLENVLTHCSTCTHASVTLDQAEDVRLRVTDNGPGIPAETLRQMEKGITRLDTKGEGFGLGLAICHRIVAAHGGSIRFSANDDRGHGLVVEIHLPA